MKILISSLVALSTLTSFSQALTGNTHSSSLNKRSPFHPIIKQRTFSDLNNESIFKDVASAKFLKVKRSRNDDSSDDGSSDDGSSSHKHGHSGDQNDSSDTQNGASAKSHSKGKGCNKNGELSAQGNSGSSSGGKRKKKGGNRQQNSGDDSSDNNSDAGANDNSDDFSEAAVTTQANGSKKHKNHSNGGSKGNDDESGSNDGIDISESDSGSSSKTSPKKSTKGKSSSSSSSSSTGSVEGGETGTITFYSQDGTEGACGLGKVDDSALVVALAPSIFKQNCGKTITITNTKTGKTAQGICNDECPECAPNHVDVSIGFWKALGSPESLGVAPVKFTIGD